MVERVSFDHLIGTTVGRYRLEQVLEATPWGPLFLARNITEQPVSGTYVVHLLQIAAALPQDVRMVYLGRMQHETNRIASLHHPAILPLFDHGNSNGVPYLVYPQLKGISLRQLLTQQGPLPLATISRYLEQLTSALTYAQQHVVLHRNLSTTNIVIAQQQQVVITNFGVLHLIEMTRQMAQPTARILFEGSSESSAPEQLSHRGATAATDMYALGVVLYRMLTGSLPFIGQRREEIIQQHLSANVPSVTTRRPDAPAGLNAVIAKSMAKEPTQRFRTPAELFAAYQQIVASQEARRGVPSGPIASSFQPIAKGASVPLVTSVGPRNVAQASFTRRRLFIVLAASGGVAATAIVVFGSHFFTGVTAGTATGSSTVTTGNTSKSGGTPTAQNKDILAHTSDLPANSAKTFPLSGKQNPGILIHLSDNRFVAFDSTCTHEGCEVDYSVQDKLLICPCHEAIFDPAKNAAVVQGPARSPLAPIKITVNADGTITTA